MADFVIEGGFDDRAILEGFKRLVDEGTKAGRRIGAGFDDELNRFGKRSIASLQQELSRLQSRQLRVNVDSTAFAKTSEKIKEVQKLIDQANNKKLTLQFDPGSINGLTARLQQLQSRALDLNVDTKEFQDAQLQVDALQQKIQRLSRVPVAAGSLEALTRQLQDLQARQVRINVDTKEFQDAQLQVDALQQKIQRISRVPVAAGSLEALNRELQDLQARQVRLNVDSRAFAATQAQIRQVERQIEEINQKKIDLEINPASINGLQRDLQRLQARTLELNVDTKEFQDAQLQVDALQQKIQRISRVPVAAGSLEALNRQLQDLQARQVRLKVDSRAFSVVGAQIQQVQGQIDNVNNRRLLINADPRSLVAMQARLQDLNQQLQRVAVGSSAFKNLQREAKRVEQAIARASGASRQLGGIGSSITSQIAAFASIAGAITLFRGVIDQAVRLETITRKLSNTLGPQGAAGALAFTKELSDRLGLSYTTLAGTFGGFTAAATAANVPIQVQKDLFAAVAKSAQSLGLSNDELQGSLLALQQIASKGTVSMEELRQQLGERLPIAFGAAANGLGVTQQELIKLVESGRLTAAEFFPALTKGLNELTAGAGGAATAAQNFQILRNEIEALQERAGRELLPGVLAFVQALTGGLQGPIKSELKSTTDAVDFLQKQIKEQVKLGLDTSDAEKKLGQLQLKAEELRTKLAGQNRQDEIKVEILGLERQRRELERQGVATDAVREKIKLLSQELFLLSGSAERVNIGQIFTGLTQETISVVPALTKQLVKAREEQELINQQIEIQSAARQRLVDAGKSTEVVDARLLDLAEKKQKLAEGLGLAQQDLIKAKLAEQAAENTAAENARKKAAQALAIEKARAEVIAQINELRRQEPVRRLDDQITVGRSLLNFAQASVGLEQERFNTARARNQYEIDNAKALGLRQDQIAARERANDELQRQSLIEQYKSLLQTQAIEAVMLQLSQRRALTEAMITVNKAKQAAIEAQIGVIKAKTPEERAQALEVSRLAQLNVGYSLQSLEILQRTVPLETAAAQAAGELARQQLRTQGASLGIEQALLNIAPAQQINNQAFSDGVAFLNELNSEAGNLVKPLNAAAEYVEPIVAGYKNANGSITILQKSAENAEESFKGLGENAENAQESVKAFKDANLDKVTADAAGSARSFAGSMDDAAGSAQRLLQYLSQASGLSPSRFTGGPVDAGTRYRINDGPGGRSLGQESFLSRAGDLSLINRPFSSLWTAPSAGIVLPAVLTDQLKQRGAFDTGRRGGKRIAAAVAAGARPSGQSTTDRLEVAVTNLAAQVQALNRKSWTVQQRVTNSPGTTQVRLLSSML